MKSGFDNGICTECAYNTKGRCSICKSSVKYIKAVPRITVMSLCGR